MGLKELFTGKSKPLEAKQRANYNMTWTLINGQFVPDEDKSSTYIDKGYKSLPNLYGVISWMISKTSIVPHETFVIKNQSKYHKYQAQIKNASTTRDYAKAMITKAQAMEKVEGTPLDELLYKPNVYQSTQEFYESLDGYLLLTGNAYLYHLQAGGAQELHSLVSPAVTIKTGDSWRNPVSAYAVDYLKETLKADEVGHLKYFNPISIYQKPKDFVYGMPPLMSCRTLLGKYKDADLAQGSAFKNMGVAGFISGVGDMTETQLQAISKSWKQKYQGASRSNDIAVVSEGVEWHNIGLSPVDLNILESKEEILGEICNVFHLPIGLFTKVNSTENNMVESRKMAITDSIIPICEKRKELINRWLAPKIDKRLHIEYDYTVFSEMSEDMEKLSKALKLIDEITPNEKRQALGYDIMKDPNMDKIYMSTGKLPLDDLNVIEEEVDEEALNPNIPQEDAETE